MITARPYVVVAARALLVVPAVLRLAFFALFAATLLLAAPRVEASQTPRCTGRDLAADLARDDPNTFAEIRAAADAVPNGRGLLWRIEADGAEPSWLFGTMHLTDERVLDLPAPVRSAFEGSNTVVIEATDVLDPQQVMAALLSRPGLMSFTDGTTLSSLLNEADRKLLEQGLDKRGVPLASVNTMKPWMIATMVALPACEMARKQAQMPFLDIKLAHDAEADGKALAGLETAIGQLEAMDSLPVDFHMRGLIATLALGDTMEDLFETMIVLYTQGEIGMIWPLMNALVPAEFQDKEALVDFERVMVTTRNHGMAQKAAAHIEAGGAFIAVGALHLPGEEGLVELLRKAGYRVTSAD